MKKVIFYDILHFSTLLNINSFYWIDLIRLFKEQDLSRAFNHILLWDIYAYIYIQSVLKNVCTACISFYPHIINI